MKASGPYQPFLGHEQLYLYLPGTGTDGTGKGIGPAWLAGTGAVVSHPTPASGFATEFRRTRFTSDAVANRHLGVMMANADHACALRGSAANRGGFDFCTRFIVNAIPNNAIRFFAGLSAQTGTGIGVAAGLPVNSIGLFCDETDSAALCIGQRAAGAQDKSQTLSHTLTAGTIYEFRMFCYPNQTLVVCNLVNLGTDSLIATINAQAALPVNTVMMAPQVALGNAANAGGGDTALDIISIYLRPNLLLVPLGTGI